MFCKEGHLMGGFPINPMQAALWLAPLRGRLIYRSVFQLDFHPVTVVFRDLAGEA